MSAEAPPVKIVKPKRLVEVSPDSEVPETRHKLSPARGILIAAGVCAVVWAAVAAAVIAAR